MPLFIRLEPVNVPRLACRGPRPLDLLREENAPAVGAQVDQVAPALKRLHATLRFVAHTMDVAIRLVQPASGWASRLDSTPFIPCVSGRGRWQRASGSIGGSERSR